MPPISWVKSPCARGRAAWCSRLKKYKYDLTGVTAGPVTIGDNVAATSNENGFLYLVPQATAANQTAIDVAGQAANGAKVAATATVSANLSTTGFAAGTYVVYAIDAAGNVSTASAAITVNAPADVTAPTFADTYPKTANVADTSLNLLVKTDENGNYYYVVLPAADTAPSVAQVKAGQDSTGTAIALSGSGALAANTEATKNITGLTASTNYKICVVASDAVPNDTTVQTVAVTTTAAKPFTITGSLDRASGIKATAAVDRTNAPDHGGNEVVIFQLMKNGNEPVSIVALEKNIQAAESLIAHFNVTGVEYTVKVFVFDQFTSNTGSALTNLAVPQVLQ